MIACLLLFPIVPEYTGERISWQPTRPASTEEGQSADVVEPPAVGQPDAPGWGQ